MRLTRGATDVVGGRVGMGETHQVKIHFNWDNLSSSSSSSIPTPYIYIYIYSSSPLLGVRSTTISFFCSPLSVFYILRAIVRCWTYSFYNTSRKPLFETHSFYHGKWNRLFWAHIFYNRFETRFFVRTVFTILFAKRCQKTIEKQCFLWMLWPETYKNQLFFCYFLANLWNSLCCRAESHKIEKKPL